MKGADIHTVVSYPDSGTRFKLFDKNEIKTNRNE
jgi:hypothetical protein